MLEAALRLPSAGLLLATEDKEQKLRARLSLTRGSQACPDLQEGGNLQLMTHIKKH